MKKVIILPLLALCLAISATAQSLNWRSFEEGQKHLLSAGLGMDYSIYATLAYGYRFQAPMPFVLGAEWSVPTGGRLLDDWKLKISGQTELWHSDRWSWSVQPGVNALHFASEIGRISSFGLELGTRFGYFRPKWGLAADFNYDRVLLAHIKNGLLAEYYPGIRDGWYGSTGGNFKIGLAANVQIRTWSAYLKVGKLAGQDFKNNPTLPAYAELGVGKRF